MFQIDLDKPFDRVRHGVLYYVLEDVGLDDIILQGVKMIYNTCTARLIIDRKF